MLIKLEIRLFIVVLIIVLIVKIESKSEYCKYFEIFKIEILSIRLEDLIEFLFMCFFNKLFSYE